MNTNTMNTTNTPAGPQQITTMDKIKEHLPGTQEHKVKKAAEQMTDTHGQQDRTLGTAIKDKMSTDRHGRTDDQAFHQTGGWGTGTHDAATGAHGGSTMQQIKAALPGTKEHKVKKDAELMSGTMGTTGVTGPTGPRPMGPTTGPRTTTGVTGPTTMGTPMGTTSAPTTGSAWEHVPGTRQHQAKKTVENFTDTHGQQNRTAGTALNDKLTTDSYGRTDGEAYRGDQVVRPQV